MLKDKLVIFDYDGVIVDSLYLWINAFETGCEINGMPCKLDEKIIAELDYVTLDQLISVVSPVASERRKNFILDICNVFDERSADLVFYRGIRAFIEDLYKHGNTLCINTASMTKNVTAKMENEGILHCFAEISGVDIQGSKSEKIINFINKYNFKPENTYMIGDTLGDIIEGKKAGVVTVAVSYGWHNEKKLLSGKPDYICSSISDLEKVFK